MSRWELFRRGIRVAFAALFRPGRAVIEVAVLEDELTPDAAKEPPKL